MAGQSSDDEGPEEVSLQSGRDAAVQQRSQEKEVTQHSRCALPLSPHSTNIFTHTALPLTAGLGGTRKMLR